MRQVMWERGERVVSTGEEEGERGGRRGRVEGWGVVQVGGRGGGRGGRGGRSEV